jgi:hypothetical protein
MIKILSIVKYTSLLVSINEGGVMTNGKREKEASYML